MFVHKDFSPLLCGHHQYNGWTVAWTLNMDKTKSSWVVPWDGVLIMYCAAVINFTFNINSPQWCYWGLVTSLEICSLGPVFSWTFLCWCPGHGHEYFLINYPCAGHTAWDLEGTNKTVWAVGLHTFNPSKKDSLVQAQDQPRFSTIQYSKCISTVHSVYIGMWSFPPITTPTPPFHNKFPSTSQSSSVWYWRSSHMGRPRSGHRRVEGHHVNKIHVTKADLASTDPNTQEKHSDHCPVQLPEFTCLPCLSYCLCPVSTTSPACAHPPP